MAQNYKVIICIIVAVWLFSLGILAGEYTHRDIAEPENPVAQQTSAYLQQSAYYADTPGSTDKTTVKTSDKTTVPSNGSSSGKLSDGRYCADAEAIRSNNFYIEGKQYVVSENNTVPLKFATDGTNSEVLAEISGIEIAMMIMENDMYLVRGNNYMKLTKTVMNAVGIDMNDYNFDSSFITDLFDVSVQATVAASQLNGEDVTCTTYNCRPGRVVLYTDGDRIVQIEQYNIDTGALEGIITVDNVSGTIPNGMLTTDGLNKQSFISFFKDLMNDTGEIE